jgi:hypothetical protein
MGTNENEREIKRLSAKTRKMTTASRASCEETSEHIKSSRSAIERSLGLLGERFHRLYD